MKTSINNIQEFYNAATAYLKEHKEETKLRIALEKVLSRIPACVAQYQEAKEDLELELANTDKHGSVLYVTNAKGAKEYQFTKENIKVLRTELKKLLNEERFEIKGHVLADALPDNIPPAYLSAFQGFVINKQQ